MPSSLASIPQAQLPTKYRDVVKLALQPRQTRAFVLAAITWHLCLSAALFGTLRLVVSPSTLVVSAASFGTAILPLLARRKRGFGRITTPPPKTPSSRAAQLTAALAHAGTGKAVTQHTAAFVGLALGYTALLAGRTQGWAPQIWVESHQAFYLNERFLYLIGHSALLGAVYTVVFRCLPSPDSAALPKFDAEMLTTDARVTIKDRVVSLASSRLPLALVAATLASTASVLVYAMVRVRVWSSVLLVVGSRGLLRRLLVPSFRVEFGAFEVGVRTTLFSVAAVCAVETAYVLLDVYLTHPLVALSKHARHPTRMLVDGIQEPVVFFASHAFAELARLSAQDGEVRAAVYRDVNSDATAWIQIRDTCLKLLEEQRQFVARRGVVEAAKPPAPASAVQQAPQQQNAQQTRTIWDQLASGESTHSSSASPAQTSGATSTTTGGKPPAPAVVSIANASRLLHGLVSTAWRLVPSDAKHVLFGPRRRQLLLGDSPASDAASLIGRDAIRTVGAVVALQSLLCHSLAEDAYGCVQKDIRRVLVALVELHTEIRRLGLELEQRARDIDHQLAEQQAEPNSQAAASSEYQQQLSTTWSSSGAHSVHSALTTAMREILDTFAKFDLQLGTQLEVQLAECLG
ncbi:uncharacterized protein PAN0_054c6472 [Moesziomyces antarcticus]|uniref:Uncharacterized protein n=2 Tax=Pseudozyma antarctica TaxID=84753 RepID=A0A5C3FXW2_PSEA2|nr:uncharacterized protein PAN0_054c6472 [Moesziomyces antarcticus]GAK68234.1 conserved hypothetical protein [Moesziomyces antarcticus]SPO49178.1 uncharacterized protein PSANT_06869 [Moesziomyces antarcticus]